ncbi:class I SAM-dependent methyltransferase [Stenotrophomonas sp.]|uniref:class I SAM-dependent methyltransferase n=1 Tax=Stenotrophomonas sp. TaxID=69392 RepID=UPI0028A9EF24|nr:class I SAM-dependent methyltransferase [Stenotrophomonas sp.]
MDTNTLQLQSALTPAALRVAVARLLKWLPSGPIALLGDEAPGLARALRQCGVAVVAGGGDTAAAAVIVVEHLGVTAPADAVQALLTNVAGPACFVVVGEAAALADRAAWEGAVIKAEWRKHPLNERVAPYGELDRVTGLLMMSFERVRAPALAVYPLKALEEERDLHTDMTREPGRRSDAHMTRYAQAAQFIRPGDRVIDVACGLGYGSYQLAHNSEAASFTGLDASDYAVEYANLNFAPVSPTPMTFVVGDAQDLSGMDDGSADFAVSVETLEHLPEPDRLLAELHRVLSPQGRVYASVPNDWSDETGEDPNPFHFHVYDWPRLTAQFQRNGFVIEKAWLQDAGGGQKRHLSARSMFEIDPAGGPAADGEWLLVLARKATATEQTRFDPLGQVRALLTDGRTEAALALLDGAASNEDPLHDARGQALAAIILTLQGSNELAQQRWKKVQSAARQALSRPETEGAAAGLLHLAVTQCDVVRIDRPGQVRQALRQHAALVSELLGTGDLMAGDAEDRAVVSGPGEGAEQINMGARDVRQLIDSKAWLDGKYHEHMQRINELESYTAELEVARQWLDGQYHALSAEIQRLNQARSQATDGTE